MFHECTCSDVVVGGPWLREIPSPAAIHKEFSKVLTHCSTCGGYAIVSVDWQGRATIIAPTKENIQMYFPDWLKDQAGVLGKAELEIASQIGRHYEKTKTAGCAQCLSVSPDTNPEGLVEVEVGQWESLFQCPTCGAYRWLMFETHGFADVPIWGSPKREDLRRFTGYINAECAKRGISLDEMVEFVFQNTV